MLSLLALGRYRDTREEFIHVLFGGVRPEPEPSCRISIAPIILFSTGDVLFGFLPLPGYIAISLQRRPSSLRGPPCGNEVERGEGGYINPKTSTFNTHRTTFASLFRSTRIKATQLNSTHFLSRLLVTVHQTQWLHSSSPLSLRSPPPSLPTPAASSPALAPAAPAPSSAATASRFANLFSRRTCLFVLTLVSSTSLLTPTTTPP